MMDSKRKKIVILLLCLLVGLALRLYTLDAKSLWIDEIHTLNDSKDGFAGQLQYYRENPSSLHPPLFFVLTHLFLPFEKPERDLRIIPLIFGVLAIPMIYLLSSLFSSNIGLPCTLSLTCMTYHIYFSQEGRSYSLLLFFGMASIYFLMKRLETLKKKYLLPIPICFAVLFHTSYSSIPFIILSQILWGYRLREEPHRINLVSILFLNGVTLFFCLPWILFLMKNYKGQPFTDILSIQDIGSFPSLMYALLNDWAPHAPLMIIAPLLLLVFPLFSRRKMNSLILLALFIFPVGGTYVYCKVLHITQLISSKYFISFFPFFLIALYLSVEAVELRFEKLKRTVRPKSAFLLLFLASNLILLPLYYRSEKQDFRGLVSYLKTQLKDQDKIVVGSFAYFPGILHYFGVEPQKRHYEIPYAWTVPGKEYEFKISLVSQKGRIDVSHSNIPYSRYEANQTRTWIVVGKEAAEEMRKKYPYVLKGYFDGSFSFFRKFPSQASMYLFLWDPGSPKGEGLNMPSE